MPKLVLSNCLPFASILLLQPFPDFWDLGESNRRGRKELAKLTVVLRD